MTQAVKQCAVGPCSAPRTAGSHFCDRPGPLAQTKAPAFGSTVAPVHRPSTPAPKPGMHWMQKVVGGFVAVLLGAGLVLVVVAVVRGIASSGGGGHHGTGLVSGTVDNNVADDLYNGMSEKDARSVLNGTPVTTRTATRGDTSATCEQWRGVNVRGITEIKATGVLWRLTARTERG